MWKLLTGILAEEVYTHLERKNLFPDEQKGCRRNSRGTKDQLMIDKMVLKNCKKRLTNLCLAWIDYKKAYDMVPHSWICQYLQIFKISDNIRNLIERSMTKWKVELTSAGERLGEVKIKRGIFQGDSLSPILFVVALIPMSIVLNSMPIGYNLGKDRGNLNHLLFMDDLKLYSRKVEELDTLVQTVRLISEDIGMEFGISKCAMIEMKRGKIVKNDGIELPDGERIRSLEIDEAYKYLWVLQSDKEKSKEMKEIVRKEYFRRLRMILRSSLNSGNTVQAINARAVSIIRYGAGIIEWTKTELKEIDRKTRKMFTIYHSMHPQGDVDRLYWKRKEGGRGLLSVQDVVKIEENSMGFYIKDKEETLLAEVVREGLFDDSEDPKKMKDEVVKKHKAAFEEKTLHSKFIKETSDVRDNKNSWLWLRKGYLKKETEGLLLAAQDQALRTRWIMKNIDKKDVQDKCRLCGERDETVAHIVSECKQLAQNEYKKCRHDKVAAMLHWSLCQQYGFPCTEKSYEHVITKEMRVLENDEVKVLWDFPIQTDEKLEHNRPDIAIVKKKKRTCMLIDVACPFDTRIERKEKEKIEVYTDLKYEILKCWRNEVKTVIIIPVVIGALGIVTKNLENYLSKIDFAPGIEPLQKTCLLGTARVLRKVLDYQQ